VCSGTEVTAGIAVYKCVHETTAPVMCPDLDTTTRLQQGINGTIFYKTTDRNYDISVVSSHRTTSQMVMGLVGLNCEYDSIKIDTPCGMGVCTRI